MSMSLQNLKVLICDDSIFVRKKMKDSLQKLGITAIYEAADGEQSVIKYAETVPDVVFMDIVMPVKTGVDALKDIMSLNPSAKVVMASSVGTQGNLTEAISAGAYDFLQKPINEVDLLKILEKISK